MIVGWWRGDCRKYTAIIVQFCKHFFQLVSVNYYSIFSSEKFVVQKCNFLFENSWTLCSISNL